MTTGSLLLMTRACDVVRVMGKIAGMFEMGNQKEDLGTMTGGVRSAVTTGEPAAAPVERRPRWSKEIALLAGKVIAKELAEQGHIDRMEVDGTAKAIAHHAPGPYTDGYSIAKALDDYEGMECNFAIAEILDGFSVAVSDEIMKAEKAWAERVKPQPPLPIGTRVRMGDGSGEITDIYRYGVAQYSVKIDGDPQARPPSNRRTILNFEDAKAEGH